jgi:hypothetical protein
LPTAVDAVDGRCLAQVEERVGALKVALGTAQAEQRSLAEQAELTKKRLERASKLTSALADEGVRWKATADDITVKAQLLVSESCDLETDALAKRCGVHSSLSGAVDSWA